MKNRRFPTTRNNIDLGWVLGQRLTRVDLDGSEPSFATLSLDTQGKAASDAHGVAISRDQKLIVVSCGGTHEVMIFRTDRKRLPWQAERSRDLIAAELLKKDGRYPPRARSAAGPPSWPSPPTARRSTWRITSPTPSRSSMPTRPSSSGTIPLGGPKTPSLARRGEILFHDAARSLNQWYSCNTCHSDGHTNGLDFDTLNDGRQDLSTFHLRSRKKVPTLRRVTHTRPWTWHGWQTEPRRRHGRVVHQEHARPQASSGGRQGAGGVPGHARLPQEPVPAARRQPHSGRPARRRTSSAPPRPPATPATAAPSSPTARSTSSASKSATTPIADTIPPRSAASTTRTPISTTAAPRPCATPSTDRTAPRA